MKRLLLPSVLALSVLAALGGGCAADLENPNGFHNPTASGGGGSPPVAGCGGGGGSCGGGGTPPVAGCGGSGGACGGSAVCDAPNVVFKLDGMMGGCQGLACHGGNAFFPDLLAPGAAARLRGVAAIYCSSEIYIDPANPANSYMLKKINETMPMCTATAMPTLQMPYALPPLDAMKTACVTEWVNAVAAGTL